ncbi:MAG: glycosyltransferase family 2 protein [Anaerolineae bacterium]|nr:glycosyltransferase family 2 protein [Anaerolineae bacterium]
MADIFFCPPNRTSILNPDSGILKKRSDTTVTCPDVSVLMPVYNMRERCPFGLLERAVESTLLRQPGVSVEICLVDDGSADRTPEIVEELQSIYPFLSSFRHEQNRGIAAALNTAASMAAGRYFIVQSVRSWYEPGVFGEFVDALDQCPDVGFVYGSTQYHGARRTRYLPPPFRRIDFFRHFASLFGYMYRREAWQAGCRYQPYIEREGRNIDISDYDFVMQLIVDLGWEGLALRDTLALHYFYQGEGQMTALVHRYQSQIDAIFRQRWSKGVAG